MVEEVFALTIQILNMVDKELVVRGDFRKQRSQQGNKVKSVPD